MKRLLSLFALAGLALLLTAPLALAAGEPDVGQGRWATAESGRMADNGEIVYRCGTDNRISHNAPDMAQINRWIQENRVMAGGVIPVNFHVIWDGSTGNVTDAQIAAQIQVLNRNYAGLDYNGNPVAGAKNTGYTFVLASVNRTVNRQWFKMTPGSRAESQAKNSLAVNWTSSLNLYTAKPGQNLLGWSTFPWDLSSNGKMDGVVIHYASLPGGSLSPYNLGGTATHEVGHWVGLYHTFQGGCDGGNCSGGGDQVCDTPGEASATSGCPSGKDTCPDAGLDPIHNYMDYSTDACYNQFTSGQDVRADAMMANYRPLIGSARVANAEELPITDFRATEAHGPRGTDAGDVVYRCATDAKGANMKAPKKSDVDLWIQQNRVQAGGVIPVYVHVITSGSDGAVSDAQIAAQIQVLNRNYAGLDYNGNPVSGAVNTGYTFVLAGTNRTNNRQWFKMTPGSRAESQAKNSLAVNWTSALNLYTAKPGQNLLGWSTFPWDLSSNGKMDGVVIHYASLPGGSLSPYNLGGTASHEVGHWVGLYHTFQGGCDGGNCSGAGDGVCDTPGEASATSGCPSGKDTCPDAGLDPIHNYMDYSTDACYNNFTAGQDSRADYMMSTYRPLIGSALRYTNSSMVQSARDLNGGLVKFAARPNPFNPRTKIEFGLAREGRATVRVFDIRGRLVSTVVDKVLAAGNHSFDFDAARLSSGVYFMRLQADGQEQVRRLSLLK